MFCAAAAHNIFQLICLIENCDDGTRQGENAVDRIYRGNCNNVLERDFESRVQGRADRLIHRVENWQDRVFNQCLRMAVKKRLREIGNECLPDPRAADDCDQLGEAAAYIIVRGKNWGLLRPGCIACVYWGI